MIFQIVKTKELVAPYFNNKFVAIHIFSIIIFYTTYAQTSSNIIPCRSMTNIEMEHK